MALLGQFPKFVCLASLLLVAESSHAQWHGVDDDNLAIIDLQEGQVYIELNSAFAPQTVEQFKKLVRAGFYDGESFYRVIDGFVAQAGDGSDMGEPNEEPTIKAEFEREWSDSLGYVRVQAPDLFAEEAGFVDGFAVGREGDAIWLVHCPGAIGMARGNEPDSSSTDFYIVIGQAPRYLDRNLNLFGRVVYGMDVVQRLRRAAAESDGIIEDSAQRSTIRSVRLGSDTETRTPGIKVRDTSSESFQNMLEQRRDRQAEFFYSKPPPVLDVCQVPNSGRQQ